MNMYQRNFWLLLSILLFCSMVEPTRSEFPKLSQGQIAIDEVGVVKNRTALIRFSGRSVKLVGYYTSQSSKPALANTIDFKGNYIKAQIVLEDGTVVHIFPSWLKQSLRLPDEAAKYTGRIVAATGKVEFESAASVDLSHRESFINLTQLQLLP